MRKVSAEVSPLRERASQTAAAALTLAMTFGACGSSTKTESSSYRDVHAAVAEQVPTISDISHYHQLNLLSTPWRAPEKMHIEGLNFTVFREFGAGGTSETLISLTKAVYNSAVLQDYLRQTADRRNYTVSNRSVRHEFFLFDSVKSLTEAESDGRYGPFTTVLANLDGQTAECVTLLAPFPPRAFIYHSKLNGSIFERQKAVSGNMLDIELSQELKESVLTDITDEDNAQALALQQTAMAISAAVSENLALAVTIKSGKDIVAASGFDDYAYYLGITHAIQEEAIFAGVDMPDLQLPRTVYDRLVI